nr:hypothetical protein CTI12_AA519410 [Tanacetum cinerariifolium]
EHYDGSDGYEYPPSAYRLEGDGDDVDYDYAPAASEVDGDDDDDRMCDNHVMAMEAQTQILQLTNQNSQTSFYNRILIVLLVGSVLIRSLSLTFLKSSSALVLLPPSTLDHPFVLDPHPYFVLLLRMIKAAKPKAKGVTIQDPSKVKTTSLSQPLQAKDNGKGIMIEPEKPLKKKDQIALDKEVVRKLKAEMNEEERIAREKNEANITMIKECDDVQATIDADRQAEEIRNKPPRKAQQKKIVEESLKKTQAEVTQGSSKRAKEELKQESAKKQRADGKSQNYLTFGTMFKNFNRKDLKVLRSIVKESFQKTKPVDDMDNLLFQTLKMMFEHHVEDIIWKYQQGAVKVNN